MKHRHRYTAARKEEAAWILDVCASSRRSRFDHEFESAFAGDPGNRFVLPNDLNFMADVHWRSISLATTAFYATSHDPYDKGVTYNSGWGATWAEAAQRLREGWQLTGDKYCALWKYE
jgi:hypothetical protein